MSIPPLGDEEDLPHSALLRHLLPLSGLCEREGLLDRDLELASRHRLGHLAQALRVRMREEGLDAQIASLGAGRLADDAPDRSALRIFGRSFSVVAPPTVSATAS